MVNKRAVSLVAGITLAVLIVIAPAIGISTLHAFLLVGVLGSVGLIVYSAVCAVRSFLQGESVDGSAALDSLLTEKKVLLRNIREIEFDQRLSKISEKEAKALLGPLRGRAKRCLQRIDELRASTSVLILIVGVLAYGEADRCFIAWAQSGPPAAMLPMMVQRVLPKADIPVGTLKLRVIGASFGEKISGLSVRVESADTDRPNAGQADQRVEQTGKTSDAGEVLFVGLDPAVGYRLIVPRQPSSGDTNSGKQQPASADPIVVAFRLPAQVGGRMLVSTVIEPEGEKTSGAKSNSSAKGNPVGSSAKSFRPIKLGEDKAEQIGAGWINEDRRVPRGMVRVQIENMSQQGQMPNFSEQDLSVKDLVTGKDYPVGASGTAMLPLAKKLWLQLEFDDIKYSTEAVELKEHSPGELPAVGVSLVFKVFNKTGDTTHLSINTESQIVMQVGHYRLGVMESLVISNSSTSLVQRDADDSAGPISFSLPEGAIGVQVIDDGSKILKWDPDTERLQMQKPFPPGPMALRFFFELPYEKMKLSFVQQMPFSTSSVQLGIAGANQQSVGAVRIGGPFVKSMGIEEARGEAWRRFLWEKEGETTITFEISHLPVRRRWPLWIVAMGAIVILGLALRSRRAV